MKKVLILAYEFPPYVSVGGLRPYSWAKYCHEFGVKATIVTRQWNNKNKNALDYIEVSDSSETVQETLNQSKILRTPYRPNLSNKLLLKYGNKKFFLLRKLISLFFEISQFFFTVGPKKELYREAKRQMKSNKFDYIIATGDPFVLFHYASKLSKEHGVPWVADYRDTWSNDISINSKLLFKSWSRVIEKKTLKTAHCISTVSNFIKLKILEVNPGKDVKIIPNGYDPEPVKQHQNQQQDTDCLTFAYAGSIFHWHPYKEFLLTLSKFTTTYPQKQINIRFFGINNKNEVATFIKNEASVLSDHITFFPKIPNDQLIKELKKCNVMLLFNYYSFMGTKIYDYLAVERFILLCFDDDCDAKKLKKQYYTIEESPSLSQSLQKDLLAETTAGITIRNQSELLKEFNNLHDRFMEKKKIPWTGKNIDQFSRRIQVKNMCKKIFI